MSDLNYEELAKAAFETYCKSLSKKGRTWRDLSTERKVAWIAAVQKVIGMVAAAAWNLGLSSLSGEKEFLLLAAGFADPAAARARLTAGYRERFANPYRAAELGYVDEVLKPEATRPRVIQALEMLRTKRQETPPRKHGNLPL